MRILLSGASGFVGRPLTLFLTSQGHEIVPLLRASDEPGSFRPIDCESFDAVIHLAGEPISSQRWTTSKKRKILFSRTIGTLVLSEMLARTLRPPKVFISASAIGYYGDRGDEILTEESPAGRGFLANVCCEWEKASRAIEARGTRVVHARFGMVLGKGGGALAKLLPIYRFGLGSTLGSGRQWQSWIALSDLIRILDHILKTEMLSGPVNTVSPNPLRQKEFSTLLASLLHRPHFLTTPAWVLKLFLGQMAEEVLLASTRVQPLKLQQSGFTFDFPNLEDALRKADL